MKIGIIGVGKMGFSIIQGITKKGLYTEDQIICYDHNKENNLRLKNSGYRIANNEIEVINKCEILILAIRPQNFKDLISKIKGLRNYPIIVSIAAGISLEYLSNSLGNEIKFIRVMPNTPLLISKGVSAISKNENVSTDEFTRVVQIFSSIGIVKEINESQMDDIIPANGSLPAFVYYFMKAFIESSVKRGIDYQLAKQLVAETIIGSAHMLLLSEKSIDELISDVCSPGGATIEGIKVFDKNKLKEVIDEAAIDCVKRAKELNQ